MNNAILKITSVLLCAIIVLSGFFPLSVVFAEQSAEGTDIPVVLDNEQGEGTDADGGENVLPDVLATISECRITRDKKSISVKGSILSEAITAYDGATIVLYELPFSSEQSQITPDRAPSAEQELKTEFSFSLPLDESRGRVYKKYAVMLSYQDELIPLCSSVAINNPEIFAEKKVVLPDGKKGILPLGKNYVLDGVDQTVIVIDAGRLMTLEREGNLSYTYGNERYYFDSAYIQNVDEAMVEYERHGIDVRFILNLTRPSDIILASRLCHPDSHGDGYIAFNTESEDGVRALRAITDFLVRRYGTSEVSKNLFSITLGTQVNDSDSNYDLFATSLSELALSYSSALRIVYNTARGICSNFIIGVSLGGTWYKEGERTENGYCARSFLDELNSRIKTETDMHWELCYDITPPKGSYAWQEGSPNLENDAPRITAANIEVLTHYFSDPSFHYNGAVRNIALIGSEYRAPTDENDRIRSTVDYVYTFLRVSGRNMKQISAYIPSHAADYEDAFRYVGTELFDEKSPNVKELIGKERFDALLLESGGSDRSYTESTIITEAPPSVKGEALIYSFSKTNDGFLPSLNCSVIEGAVSYGSSSGLLRVRLGGAGAGEMRGICVKSASPLDLSNAPYLSFTLRSFIPADASETALDVTVAVWSGDGVHVCRGTVATGKENTVVCDMRSFSGLSSCDRIGIYVSSPDDANGNETTLMIGSIKALSETMTGQKLENAIHSPSGRTKKTVTLYTVIAIALVGASAIGIEAIRIVRKTKGTNENE